MLDLGLALFLALVAAGIGKRLLNWIGELPDHPLDALALATPLGLGLLALGCLLLGQAGWLNLVGLAVLLGVATELGLLAGFRLVRELARHSLKRPEKGLTTVVDRLLLVFLVLTLGATALAARRPSPMATRSVITCKCPRSSWSGKRSISIPTCMRRFIPW